MPQQIVLMVFLASVWGASFLFMRILAPYMHALPLANTRILVAGLVLLFFYMVQSQRRWAHLKQNAKPLFWIGLFNSAIPFALYAFAAHHIPAAYSAILNALTPIFTALIARLFFNTTLSLRVYFGLMLGFIGVYVLMYPSLKTVDITSLFAENGLAILSFFAGIGATICYAIGTNYSKAYSQKISSLELAMGSQLMIGFLMLPISFSFAPLPKIQIITEPKLLLSVLLLGGLCSGVAYRLFFSLLQKGGPIYASLVTFLIPLFGILWGFVFLHEAIPQTAYISTLIIFMATFLVMKKS